MKKLSLLLIMALLITMFPFNVFAKESNALVSKSYKPFMVDNDFDYIKQKLSEDIDELYDGSLNNKYTDELRKLIDGTYNDLMEIINNATYYDEIIDTDSLKYLVIEYNDSIYQKKLYLASLMDFNYSVVRKGTNFNDIKKRAMDNIDLLFENLYFDDYNDYYKSKIDYLKEEIYSNYDKVLDYSSLANANANVLRTIYGNFDDTSFEFNYDNNTYEYDRARYTNKISPKTFKNRYTLQDESYDDILWELEVKNYNYRNLDLNKKIYTEDEVNVIKSDLISLLEDYFYREVYPETLYTEEIEDIIYGISDEIYDACSVDEIMNLFDNAKDDLVKLTNVKFKKLTGAEKQRIQNKVYKLSFNYLDRSKYSAYNYSRIEYMFEVAQECYNNAIYKFEIPEFFVSNLEEILKTVPTLQQELKSTKNKYIGYLKVFLNNKKYNQNKVRPIVNEGISKINKATSASEVKSIYNSYYNKAKGTINTYKITTVKEGKGYITKGKVVNYGTSFTIKITPNKGYRIKSLYVDGKKVKVSTKYTFKNIKASHKVKVVFVKK